MKNDIFLLWNTHKVIDKLINNGRSHRYYFIIETEPSDIVSVSTGNYKFRDLEKGSNLHQLLMPIFEN